MRALVHGTAKGDLRLDERALPLAGEGEVLLRVRACGVCRTDLHIVDGELPVHHDPIVPGHQIVGEVVAGATPERPLGMRVGVSWIASTDGTCAYCRRGSENLCDALRFTGYDRDGGYAEYTLARADFTYPLDDALDDVHAAPLLCAGIIGFRALRVAGVERGERVGLYGFGASAHLMVPVLRAWDCEVYVATRGESHRAFARSLGVDWVGEATDRPPVGLDRAVTFAPAGDVVIAALGALRKGGIVAINAIHLDRIPQFDYDSLLWGERQLRSVANMTRQDAYDFLALATQIGLRPKATVFPLERGADALAAIRGDAVDGAAVIVPT
ncbi:MAG TPA: zinc-dependent alcohol dehydrogenase family protein [Candidatus Limnocylindria bacterium]|nr:zinc-dependent alcohol dehydrogenase family protein [Candidatus Limnocylindria bacterium]